MATFLEKYASLDSNSELYKRTEIALLQLGSDLTNEAFDANNGEKSILRKAMGIELSKNVKAWTPRYLNNMVSRADFPDNPTDAEIKNYASAEINDMLSVDILISNAKDVVKVK